MLRIKVFSLVRRSRALWTSPILLVNFAKQVLLLRTLVLVTNELLPTSFQYKVWSLLKARVLG